jgi:predicted DNA-binding protein
VLTSDEAGRGGAIAVTVRLDPTRYERLKIYGVRQRRTNQELLVEAIDTFLDDREGQGRD